MAQLTAVEWFLKELIRCGWFEEGQINITLEQAKQMEKDQIIKAYGEGYENAQNYVEIGRKEYYNKTYEI